MYCCKRLGLLNSSCASVNQYAFLEVFSEGTTIQDALHKSSKVNCCYKSDKQIDLRYVIQKRTKSDMSENYSVIRCHGSEQQGEVLDPYNRNVELWIDDVSRWPPIEFPHVYTYLIDTPGEFTREKLKAFKSLQAYNY